MKDIDLTITIGGEAGQGIQTVGQLLALTGHHAGLHIIGINDFESRIRGGHSFFQLRLSNRPVRAPHHNVHLLIAMDAPTLELHKARVLSDGLIIVNRQAGPREGNVVSLPVSELAQKTGSPITANTVAAGAALALLGAPFDFFQEILARQFAGKDARIVEQNIAAATLGYEAVRDITFAHAFEWLGPAPQGMLLEGSHALALGALAGDCRFVAFYPMSPATGIMIHLAAYQDRFPLVVEQAEDEIAAVNMIIGAAYAGVRSLTATSGGGFCLMTEGLGLAGITETPIVIINAQRPGPATGLPTRTAQGDLQFVLHAAQDDFPRFVFAPGSPEEGFRVTARALELAEKYQTPAVILVDQFFNDSLFSIHDAFAAPASVPRYLADDTQEDDGAAYRRYALTESGISPRALPCRGHALVMSSGNEHREDGHIAEEAANRTGMVDKRARKQAGMRAEMRPPAAYYGDAATLIVGWGSTQGIIREAADMLRQDGTDAGAVHFCDIWPFPGQHARAALEKAARFFIVEQNSTGQFARLLRQETGMTPAGSILTYDGRPLYPADIYHNLKAHRG